jgi:hypothetical protein
MEATTHELFDAGAWIGRQQAFALVSSKCSRTSHPARSLGNWPAILRRGRHRLIDNLARVFEFLPRRKGRCSPTFFLFHLSLQ